MTEAEEIADEMMPAYRIRTMDDACAYVRVACLGMLSEQMIDNVAEALWQKYRCRICGGDCGQCGGPIT